MLDVPVSLFISVGVFLVFFFAFVWSIFMQRKGLSRQKDAVDRIEESMAMSRQSIGLLVDANALRERMLHNQEEMVRLLRVIADERGVADISTSKHR